MCEDMVVNSAFKGWANSVLGKPKGASRSLKQINNATIDKMLHIHKGYASFQHAIQVEVSGGRNSTAKKCKATPWYINKVWSTFDEKMVNVWAIRDLNRVIEMKKYFLDHDIKFYLNGKSYYEWVVMLNECGHSFPMFDTTHTLHHVPTLDDVSAGVGVGCGMGVDYAYRVNPKRIKMVDERKRVCLENIAFNQLEMTSGFVGGDKRKMRYDSNSTTPSTRFNCTSRPIVVKYASVPAFEDKLEQSKKAYLKRKANKMEQECRVESDMRTSFGVSMAVRERSISESSDEFLVERKCCSHDLSRGMNDERMIHSFMCTEFSEVDRDRMFDSTTEATLKDAERLWFINKIPELSFEYAWLDAKVRRGMTDWYSFGCCQWCREEYTILNFMKMQSHVRKFEHYGDVNGKSVDMMKSYCSYSCYNNTVIEWDKYNRDQDLCLTKFDRVRCTVCCKSTYSYCEPDNTWRTVNYRDCFNSCEIEFLPICSDECYLLFIWKSDQRKILAKSGEQTIANFTFYTCFSCSKLLLPNQKVVHFRNFPRVCWAFCCYDEKCVEKVLRVVCPMNPVDDYYFKMPSVPVPFDRVDGKETCHPVVQATLRELNVKEMSSASGGRFILTILE